MKKTLVMIIAIVLIISVCFVFVGCPKTPEPNPDETCTHVDANKDGKCDKCGTCVSHVDANSDGKCDNCGKTMPSQGGKDPTAADLELADKFLSYAEAWVLNNAEEAKKLDSVQLMATAYANSLTGISTIQVKAENGGYKVTYKFKSGAKCEKTLKLVEGNNGHYAGLEFAGATAGIDADHALGAIINAAFKTCKIAVENGQAFNENGFGFDATAYFDFYYGEMAQKLTYGLRLSGQIGILAKDTFAGIEILNGNDVIGGLYYQGAENKADCKLYLNAGDYKYYIDNADINAIVVSVIEAIQGIIGGQPIDPEVKSALADPFYETKIETLSELLPENLAIVGTLISGVMKDVNKTDLGNGSSRYQISINLSALLDAIKTSFGSALSGITEKLPAPLNQLDLGTFQGVGGVILITAVVSETNGLGGFELSYNAPKQDFRFNYQDNEPKVYGPINVALGIKGFELGAQDVADIIPSEVSGYDYFSPLNAQVKVDVEVNDVPYTADIVSSINPFAIEEGVITFVVDKDAAAWLNGRLEFVATEEGLNALVAVDVDGQVYKFYASELGMTVAQIAQTTFQAVLNSDNVFTPVINYVVDLINQFAPANNPNQPELTPAGEDGGLSLDAITGALGIVDAAKALIEKWQSDGVLVYKLDGETLLDNYFQVKLSADEYNQVIELVNQYLAPIIGTEFEPFTADAAKVLVSANYGDHAKQVYVSVEYKDTTVLVLLDGSKWENSKTIDLTVDVNGVKYILALDASTEGVYNLTYTANETKYVDITLDLNEKTIAATLVANGNTHQFNGSLVFVTDDNDNVIGGTIKLDLDGVVVDLTGKLAYGEVTGATSFGVPTVKFGAQFGWILPNNTTNVKVDVELVSWGSEVVLADNAELMEVEATANIADALQSVADAFLQAIALPVNE